MFKVTLDQAYSGVVFTFDSWDEAEAFMVLAAHNGVYQRDDRNDPIRVTFYEVKDGIEAEED